MSILQDSRFALRLLAKARVSTAIAILSLALGIGATTAIFSVVYAVLVDPYPYADADRIGGPWIVNAKGQHGVDYTIGDYIEMKSRSKSAESIILNARRSVILTEAGLPEAVNQEFFSPNAFEFFGVPPLFGRTFTPHDAGDESKVEPVAVLSYLFWQRHFSGRRDILGQQVRLNDKFYTVIGVLPVRFTWNDADIYTPLAIQPGGEERYGMVLKIKPGMPREQLNAEFQSFHEKFAKTAPSFLFPEAPFRTEFQSVNEGILGKFANTLMALLAAVGFLLLIACANVANLLLARASARQGEMAVRITMGANRKRIFQQLLTESVILSVTGGILGIVLAYGGVKAVVALMPEYSVPHEAVIAINVPVLIFAVVISVLTGILFGLAPALQLSRQDQNTFLKSAGRDAAAGSASRRLRNALIVAEVTLSLVLLTGATLAASGMLELTGQKLGYQPKGVLIVYAPVPAARYPQWSQRRAFFTDIVEQFRKMPGVQSAAAAATGAPPYTGAGLKFDMDGLASTGNPLSVNLVSEGYFSTIGISLLKGRFFDSADVTRATPVAVVTENMVKKYFPADQDPIGHQLRIALPTEGLPPGFVKPAQPASAYEIIGVCSTVRNNGLRDTPEPAVYIPVSHLFPPGMMFAIRTDKSDPLAISNAARQAVSAVDSTQPITFVRTLEDMLNNAVAYPRFATFLFGIFGAIGLALACTGIFSVVSYAVSRRTREFGIRMALGATPANVLKLILSSTGGVLIAGFALGAMLSAVASRTLAGKLEGIGAASPLLLSAVVAALAIAALAACAIPARSATRVQPVEALRHE
jgi:predicted permease